jgi:hypothetical protein
MPNMLEDIHAQPVLANVKMYGKIYHSKCFVGFAHFHFQ